MKAWGFLERACSAGDALGCAELSQLYVEDDGLRLDAKRAAELAQAACDGGDGHGCVYLVEFCAERVIYPGEKDPCDTENMRRLYDRAVAVLHSSCGGWGAYDCFTLGTMYDPSDPPTALRFASEACEAGDPGGCDSVASLYERQGEIGRARELYGRACAMGLRKACARS